MIRHWSKPDILLEGAGVSWHWYFSALALAGGAFVWTLTRLSRLYWRQSLLLVVTVLLPFLANILHNLNVGPFGRVELTPFLFVLTGAVLVWGIFRFRLLDLAPIARSSVLATIQDGVLVLDPYRRVVNLNPAGQRVLASRPPRRSAGRPRRCCRSTRRSCGATAARPRPTRS
jgi:hypothetical protein